MSNGLLLATIFGCTAAVLGLIVGSIALSMLLRRGYGPFLRILAFGRHAGKRRKKQLGHAAELEEPEYIHVGRQRARSRRSYQQR